MTQKITEFVFKLLSCPVFVCSGVAALSIFSLASAYIAEYVFGLKPCILCLYQRIPFALTILLGIVGVLLSLKDHKLGAINAGLSSVVFLGGASLAFYHTGVERHWWTSVFEACKVDLSAGSIEELIVKIEQSEAVPCDEIPWADPVLGLSMANYNAIMSFCVAMGCAVCAYLIWKRAETSN